MNDTAIHILIGIVAAAIGHFWGRTGADKEWMRNCAEDGVICKYGYFYKVITEGEHVDLIVEQRK